MLIYWPHCFLGSFYYSYYSLRTTKDVYGIPQVLSLLMVFITLVGKQYTHNVEFEHLSHVYSPLEG